MSTSAAPPDPDGPHPGAGGRDGEVDAALTRAWRQDRAAVLASVVRRVGDLALAEDAVQEAFASAARTWPRDGSPARPGAWLTTVARRAAVDRLRRDRFPVADTADGGAPPDDDAGADGADGEGLSVAARSDDLLSLILVCCHPALAPETQVALTLRHVVGLTDADVAARLLVPPATLTKRLVRARAKIRDSRIRFALPDRTVFAQRTAEVRTVLYLIFTQGYVSGEPARPVRAELCAEAIWLARQLHALTPDDAETTALLALLLLHHSRARARQDPDGGLVLFAAQDRSLWDADAVTEARQLLGTTAAGAADRPGPYRLQAAIALLHATASPDGQPPWPLVADLYGLLERHVPSPAVAVNRAAALARAGRDPEAWAVLRPLLAEPRLARYTPLLAVHAELLDRAGDPGAEAAWQAAADTAPDPARRQALLRHRPPR